MPRVEYERIDLVITVRKSADGQAHFIVTSQDVTTKTDVPSQLAAAWFDTLDRVIPNLAALIAFADPLRHWQARVPAFGPMETLRRVRVELYDNAFADLDWERSLVHALATDTQTIVVRALPLRARVLSIPFTLPMRILEIASYNSGKIQPLVNQIFGFHPLLNQAMVVDLVTLAGANQWLDIEHWPTADVLHFDEFPTLAEPKILFSTAEPDKAGTLGWLMRLADSYQTRLIVLNVQGQREAERARRLAAEVVARGGPAILVGDFSGENLNTLYDSIIHDQPFDRVLREMKPERRPSLFAGGEREEMLRVSNVGLALVRLADAESMSSSGDTGTIMGKVEVNVEQLLHGPLQNLRQLWGVIDFTHESGGLLPLSQGLETMRQTISIAPERAFPVARVPQPSVERFVNSSLWNTGPDGALTRLEQKNARLAVGAIYQLGIQIGPRDVTLVQYGAESILEETFKWTPKDAGRWLEIGVVGLNFDVIGEPLQELWLPRDRPSEMIYFAVSPRGTGIARLRIGVYCENNLIQSWLLGALTRPVEPFALVTSDRHDLAAALDIPLDKIGDVGYLSRLEYSLTAEADGFASRRKRALTIVANNLDGQSIITVKGPDIFQTIQPDNTLPDYVQAVRDAYDEISQTPVPGVDRASWPYAFYPDNHGEPDELKDKLRKLAENGWKLYSLFVDENGRAALENALANEDQTIQVAHILLEKVIPWAALYDRNYDANKQSVWQNGKSTPVEHDTCLASLPKEDGTLPVKQCGTHSDCPLHPLQIAKRLQERQRIVTPETVACPLHFWGVKHIIELPPQQVKPTGVLNAPTTSDAAEAQELFECILAKRPAQLMLGYNAVLALADNHWNTLEKLPGELKLNAVWKPPQTDRDEILKSLDDPNLDLVYLYCHARGGKADPAYKFPFLEFQSGAVNPPGMISAENLDSVQRWAHHPLVILNGCHTAAFSPDALSPFVKKLVRGRGAAGVIGTEIPVWEQLATEMALIFLRQFLGGASAGRALLHARRVLLAKYNPLGLVYTLYASGDLKLDRDADGKCG